MKLYYNHTLRARDMGGGEQPRGYIKIFTIKIDFEPGHVLTIT